MSVHFRNTCALILLVLAFTRPVGYLFDNYPLNVFGMAMGFSPLPMPFTQRGEYENYSTAHSVSLRHQGGSINEMQVTRESVPILKGPHRYKVPMFVTFSWGLSYPQELIFPMYEYMFCSGTFTQDDISDIAVDYTDERTGVTFETTYYECNK